MMKALVPALLLLLVTSLAKSDDEAAPLVKTMSGDVVGIKEESTKGNPFFSYYSIPFAQPPVGDLRFKNPVKVQNWDGVRQSSQYPSVCPQFEFMMQSQMLGDEDCLYLNLFTSSPNEESKRLPVMVFIHGGGFFMGSTSDYPPHVMMNEDILFVTIQYRLGMLGFLSTEDDDAPGNLGLKDQTMALGWIQNNAHLFGGDPTKITLVGESAGAASVHHQILSPRAVGLFQRAILMSGSALCPFAIGGVFKEVAEYTAKVFNCTTDDGSKKLISCLQKLSVEELVPVQQHFTVWFMNPFLFGPRVDKDFLPSDPEVLMKQKRHKRLDIMSGVTTHEGGLYSIPIYANEGYRAALMLNFPQYGPISLEFSDGDFSPLNQTIKIYDYYLGGVNLDADHADNLTQMFSDRYFNIAHDLTTDLHAKNVAKHKKKVYRYELSHRGQRSINDRFGLDIGKHYVSHADDLFYLFSGSDFLKPLDNEDDLKLRDIMTKMWVNFAKHGDPTPDDSLDFKWEPITQDKFHHLNLKLPPTMEDDHRAEVREFWASLPLKQNLLLHPDRVSNLTAITFEEMEKMEEEAKASLEATIAEARVVLEAAQAAKKEAKEEVPPEEADDQSGTRDTEAKEQSESKDEL